MVCGESTVGICLRLIRYSVHYGKVFRTKIPWRSCSRPVCTILFSFFLSFFEPICKLF